MPFNSEQGFVVYYNRNSATEPQTRSTVFPAGRVAEFNDMEYASHWIISDGAETTFAVIPDREVMAILRLETVGPGDANKPQ
jgi:hypothetical protein